MGSIGLAIPALVMVILSTITSDFPDIYSATCSIMNISSKVKPKMIMWITGIVSIGVALVFPVDQYENFLLLIGAMFVPLFGVVLTDYFLLRRRRIDVGELYKPGGMYWYTEGFNVIALVSWAVGFITFEIIAYMKYSVGGSIPAMLVAGLLYFLMTRIKERTQK